MNSLVWKVNRLRTMGFSEILHRVYRFVQSSLESRGLGLAQVPKQSSDSFGVPWVDTLPTKFSENVQLHLTAADNILAGNFTIFAKQNTNLGFPPDWNRDPRTGIKAPLVFGKTLNYRDETIVGDIKYLWELNRHLELVTLAQAFHLTGDITYAKGVQSLLSSWFQQCPYPQGVNWTSSLEHSVRLVNWSFTWHMLGGEYSPLFEGESGEKFKQNWLESIYQHLHFISGHFSRYSSANNHLLGEYMGLLIGSLTWPLWDKCMSWQKLAYQGFLDESLKQNASDGVNLEQGIWYHHEVADMMLLCALVGKANGVNFPQSYWNRLEAMLEFIASIMDTSGNVPMIGDSDDAVMVRFSSQTKNIYRSLLATGAVLFHRGDFKSKAINFDDKSRWLLGDEGKEKFDALASVSDDSSVRREFPEGGYYILGDNLDSPDEIRIVADAGPLGYLSIAAHGHADALSFTLSVSGDEFLIDSGTYAYHTKKEWRDYFRGTSAHNAIRVDEIDQSEPGGNFMWLSKATSKCEEWKVTDEGQTLSAMHDGYKRLSDPVIHRRKLQYINKINEMHIKDTLECAGSHIIERMWHFSEECEVVLDGRMLLVKNGENSMTVKLATAADISINMYKGSESPIFGWISRHFDGKMPITTVVERMSISGTTILTADINCRLSG